MEVVPDDHMLLFFCIDYTIWPGAVEHGVWKSQKSLIQHCERSELRLHFEWTKVPKNAKKLKLVENAKCDIFGDFQTLCSFSYFFTDNFFFLKLTQLPKLLSNFFRMESSWSLHFVQKESVGNQNSSEIESGRTSENENGLPQVSTKITQGEGIKSGHQRKNGFISKKFNFRAKI